MTADTATENGIYYFLGNITSHILHALPLHKKIGGTFVVLSKQALEEVKQYDVPVICIDDKPGLGIRFGASIKNTVKFLNQHADVVLFYEIYEFSPLFNLSKPRKIFLTHGNMLKSYMTMYPRRVKVVNGYDYMAALGPYLKKQFVEKDGVKSEVLVDLGIARTDEVVKDRAKVVLSKPLARELGIGESKKPIVSYMPTFWGPSSVYHVGKEIVRNIPEDYLLIFRPHPQTPGVIINEYLDIIETRPKGTVVYAPEGRFKHLGLSELMAASSLIIGDVSSVMLEAILTNKPLIFAYSQNKQRQSEEDYAAIREVVNYSTELTAESVRSLPFLLRNALARGVDNEIWQLVQDRTFFHNKGDSVDSIAEFVRSLR